MDITKYKLKYKFIDLGSVLFNNNKQNLCISNYTIIIDVKESIKYKNNIVIPNSVKRYKFMDSYIKNKYIRYPNSIKNINYIFCSGLFKNEFIKNNIINGIFFNKLHIYNNTINKKNKTHNIFLFENMPNMKINYYRAIKNMYYLKNTNNINLVTTSLKLTESFLFRNIKYLRMYKYNNCALCTSNVNVLLINNCENMLDVKSFKNIKQIKICLDNSNKKWCNFNAFYFKNICSVILYYCEDIINICMLKNIRMLAMHNCIENITWQNAENIMLKYTLKYKFVETAIINEYIYHHKHNTHKIHKMYENIIYLYFQDN